MPAFPVKLHVAPAGVYANAALKSGASKLLFPIGTGTALTAGTAPSAAARKTATVTTQYGFVASMTASRFVGPLAESTGACRRLHWQ